MNRFHFVSLSISLLLALGAATSAGARLSPKANALEEAEAKSKLASAVFASDVAGTGSTSSATTSSAGDRATHADANGSLNGSARMNNPSVETTPSAGPSEIAASARRKPASNKEVFSDGTSVEKVVIADGQTVLQIKQKNGKVCYAISSSVGAGTSGNGAGMACTQ